MKVELLCLGVAIKPSPISEGVMEIRINNQPCNGINLTIRHTQACRAPRVAIVHDVVREMISAHLTLVHVFHTYASADTPWVAHALSHCTPVRYGKIASISGAHNATQFRDFICPICISTFQMLVHSNPTNAGLNRHRRGLPPWSSKFMIQTTLNLPIQYSPFSPNCPPILILNHSINYSTSQLIPITNQGIKALNLTSGIYHSTSTGVLSTKHSTTNGFSTTIGAR
jgi:hypothetical protein